MYEIHYLALTIPMDLPVLLLISSKVWQVLHQYARLLLLFNATVSLLHDKHLISNQNSRHHCNNKMESPSFALGLAKKTSKRQNLTWFYNVSTLYCSFICLSNVLVRTLFMCLECHISTYYFHCVTRHISQSSVYTWT